MNVLTMAVPGWLATLALAPLCFWLLVEIRNAFTHK